MLGVIAEVELLFDLLGAERLDHIGIVQQLSFEVGPMFPDFQGVALHEGVGVFAADTRLSESQKHALRHHQTRKLVHVFHHVFRKNQHLVDHTC